MSELTVSSTWSSAQPVDSQRLITKVARLYGLSDDEDAQAIAKDALDDTVKELNGYLYEFNIVTATGLTLTDAQSHIQLAVPFFKEKMAYLVRTGDGKPLTPLTYLDWAAFNRLYGTNTTNGDIPQVYSARNMQEEGRLYFGPTPNDDAATNYTLSLEYYRRISLVSETPQLTIFQEAENALLYGAQMRFAYHISGPSSPDVGVFKALFNEALASLRSLDRRHPDEATRFRLPQEGVYARRYGASRQGGLYIKIT